MKKIKFIIAIVIAIIFGSATILLWAIPSWLNMLRIDGYLFPIGYEKTEKNFTEDYELLVIVTQYFANSNYDDIYIHYTMEEGVMSVSGERIMIEDSEIVETINVLERRGYQSIGKGGNTIYFLRSTRLMDFGSGVAYSIDGSEPKDKDPGGLQFLTKLEPLSVPNWYYYEEDYNEWRIRNKSKE